MTTISITELPAFIENFSKGDATTRPLGIITNVFVTSGQVLRFLVWESGGRCVDDLLIAGAERYFDAEGNLRDDISEMEQQLADGSKVNASEYLAGRVADYTEREWPILFAVHNVYTPQMGGVARYIAREAGRPLVALLPPVSDPEATYPEYDIVVCDR